MRVFAHGFSAAAGEPEIARESRRLLAQIHAMIIAAGATEEQAWMFLGRGFLINTLILLDVPAHMNDEGLAALTRTVLAPPPAGPGRPDSPPVGGDEDHVE